MKYLLFSMLLSCLACRSDYDGLHSSNAGRNCAELFNIPFKTSWYSASIDVYGKHLSGLLLIKELDGNYRTVFTNEAGVTFFDFEFSKEGSFSVKRVIRQLDRKAVINVLRDDFSLLLRIPFNTTVLERMEDDDEIFYMSRSEDGRAFIVTDAACSSIKRLESGSKRSRKVSILLRGEYFQPGDIKIDHHTFDMTIGLKKIERE
jgi:hypothetical protein